MAHDSSSCLELARNGAKVYMASRTESKARDAIEKIKKAVPNADIHFLQLDLTELAAVRKEYGIMAEKHAGPGNYQYGHSSFTYLIDREGKRVARLPAAKGAVQSATDDSAGGGPSGSR